MKDTKDAHASLPDAVLLERFVRAGSASAFTALVERHTGMVFRACLRRLNGDAHAAEDAAQAVFILLARKAGVIRDGRRLAAWLFQAAGRVVANQRREETRRRRRETAAAVRSQEGPSMPSPDPSWEAARGVLDASIAGLRPAQREAVILHYLEGRPYGDVAAALGCSEEAARKRAEYGLEKMRRFFSGRGIVVTAGALAAGLAAESALAAPAGLAEAACAAALGGGAGSPALALAEKTLRQMACGGLKVAACVLGSMAAAAVAAGVWAFSADSPAPAPAGPAYTQQTTVSPRDLRGYGTLSAQFGRVGPQASHLKIQCAGDEKARIVHAKFLADLRLLLDVKEESIVVDGTAFRSTAVPRQGQVIAFRKGAVVHVVAGPNAEAVKAVLLPLKAEWSSGELTPTGKVPMYLDAWDQYGFRFYYWPYQLPEPKPGEKRIEWRDYNVLGEFDFAQRCGKAGMVAWLNEDKTDFAEGMTNEILSDWVARASAKRGLPYVVNGFVGDASWLVNRYRRETQQRAPSYCGGYYTAGDAYHAGNGHISWCSGAGRDAALATIQNSYRRYAARENTIEYLEPHGELRHGEHDILTEHGPLADASYRTFLKQGCGTVQAVSRRWFGNDTALRSWDDVRVPEPAHFLGFDAKALDLGGPWRVSCEPFKDGKGPPTDRALEEWYQPDFKDESWPEATAPQSDLAMFLPRRPAVWRRRFPVPADWKAARKRVWLYVFSLNRSRRDPSPVWLNGKKVAEPAIDGLRHWTAAEVTEVLKAGENLLALRLPENFLGYRVYLSGHEPVQYPYLGEGMNAQWADFIRWQAWTRVEACRRGFEMIRQADPDRSVVCMAPDSFVSGLKTLCEDYGGHFHNTGYMSGWWAEPLPMLMRSADMPFSLEPGGPAANLNDFKLFMGNWLTEGVNAVHYYIHVGNVYWHDEIRPWFEDNLPIVGAIGKVHVPKAEAAMLYGDDVENLTGWPWEHGDRGNLPSGYVPYQINMGLHKEVHLDAVTPPDFGRGTADGYRVVIDTNTSVMDPKTVDEIEAWVKRGGVFVANGHTGRHTPEKADCWPISRLTGYKVLGINRHPQARKMSFVPGQKVFVEEGWDAGQLNRTGQTLEKADPAFAGFLRWSDGTVAVGMRELGKGAVIDVGCHYNNHPLLFRQLLAWLKIRRIPAVLDNPAVTFTHAVSNNGLYDVWILWNWDRNKAATVDFAFRDGLKPEACIDLKTKKAMDLTSTPDGARLAGLAFQPLDIRIFVTPRGRIADAPLAWLNLQRGWWRGTAKPSKPIPAYVPRFALDLADRWAMKPLEEKDKADIAPMAAPGFDDSSWKMVRFGNWLVPDELPTRRAFFRRKFSVPAHWKDGEIDLRIMSWHREAVRGRLRVWLDGAEIQSGGSSVNGLPLAGKVLPGKTHLLAVEMAGEGQVAGAIGNAWLYCRPKPQSSQDLAGEWVTTRDCLSWEGRATLPGPWDYAMARRKVRIDRSAAGKTVLVRVETAQPCGIYGVMVNGRWVMRLHHEVGPVTELNVTPWVRFGEENEIHVVRRGGGGKAEIKVVRLDYYREGEYP